MLPAQEFDAPSDVNLTMAHFANSDTCGGEPQYTNYSAYEFNILSGGELPYGECNIMPHGLMAKFYCSGGSWNHVQFNSDDADCTGTPVQTNKMVRRVLESFWWPASQECLLAVLVE